MSAPSYVVSNKSLNYLCRVSSILVPLAPCLPCSAPQGPDLGSQHQPVSLTWLLINLNQEKEATIGKKAEESLGYAFLNKLLWLAESCYPKLLSALTQNYLPWDLLSASFCTFRFKEGSSSHMLISPYNAYAFKNSPFINLSSNYPLWVCHLIPPGAICSLILLSIQWRW